MSGRAGHPAHRDGFQGRSAYKMLIRADDGWRVWGSIPAALMNGIDIDTAGSRLTFLTGKRVTFTATVEAKVEDPLFGFFTRPRRATIVTEPAPA